jgi:hypothetical protein
MPTQSEENNQSTKYTQITNKIKEVLNTLQKNLLDKKLNISFPSAQITSHNINQKSSQIDRSIMTTDSLISNTSYSVSSTLPLSNKNSSLLTYGKSTINVEKDILHIELDSLNSNHYLYRTKFLNLAKNLNSNQQTSEDDGIKKSFHYTRSQSTDMILFTNKTNSKQSDRSRRVIVQYMSPSFMFVLQLLLVLCLINRILMYSFFGIVPTDTSMSFGNSQSAIPISPTLVSETEQTVVSTNVETFHNFLLSLFKLI